LAQAAGSKHLSYEPKDFSFSNQLAMRAAVCAGVFASAAGLRRSSRKVEATAASRYIAGVPVFELATETARDEHWVVFMKDGGGDSAIDAFCGKAECMSKGSPSSGGIPFVSMKATEASLAEMLKDNADVEFVTPDYVLEPDLEPSPEDAAQAEREAVEGQLSMASGDWGLTRIGVPEAKFTGKDVNVYVFDSGVNTRHEEFEKRGIPTLEWSSTSSRAVACVESDRSCADDYLGHGTHVAGIVGGANYGVAPDATIRAMMMWFNTADRGVSVAYESLDWLARNRQLPAILQMSFGWPQVLAGSEVAINKVIEAGITVVAAGGNSRADACAFTWGHIPGVIVVAASDSRDYSASFTNWGECTDLYAPGVSITAANHRGGLTSKSGTSMAAPMVSGAVALLLEANPQLTPAQVKKQLLQNAEVGAIKNLPRSTPNLLLKVA